MRTISIRRIESESMAYFLVCEIMGCVEMVLVGLLDQVREIRSVHHVGESGPTKERPVPFPR